MNGQLATSEQGFGFGWMFSSLLFWQSFSSLSMAQAEPEAHLTAAELMESDLTMVKAVKAGLLSQAVKQEH